MSSNEITKIINQSTMCERFRTVLSVSTHSLTRPVTGCSFTFKFGIKSDDTNRPEGMLSQVTAIDSISCISIVASPYFEISEMGVGLFCLMALKN